MKNYDDFSFFGDMSDFNFNSYSHTDLVKKLIEKNIYLPIENNDIVGIKLAEHSFSQFNTRFIYNKIAYKLNPKIPIQIFYYNLMLIKLFEIKTLGYFKNSIETRIFEIDNTNDIINILKRCRKKLIAKSINYVLELDDFINYLDVSIYSHKNNINMFYNVFSDSEIEHYLSLKNVSYEGVFLTKWKKFVSQNIQIKYYNEKIMELEKLLQNDLKIKLKINPLNEIIFKETGENIFSYIITKYPKTKNTAFFSYLYFYFRDKLKLLNTAGNDSKNYRDFIIDLFNIPFARIQITNSQNQYKKNEMFELFDIYIKNYYSLKTDNNLSKNE